MSGVGVRLRPLRQSDDAALVALFADPDTRVWNPGPAEVDVPRWRAENAELAEDFRTWVVTDAGDELLGVVSLFSIEDEGHSAEIGFRTVPAARGRGLARAAVEQACAWAAQHRDVRRVVLYHATGNPASCRVAQACGFALESHLPANHPYGDGALHDEHLHARTLPGRR